VTCPAGAAPQIFERDYYRKLYTLEERHWWARGMRDAMVALLDGLLAGRTGLRALDVGCGTGYLLGFLDGRYPLAGPPVGIDVSAYALDFCRRRSASRLARASAVDLPFASESFDLVVCIDTLQHLSPAGADRKAVAELVRLLRPGGVLYLRTNSRWGHPPLRGADPDQYRRYDLGTVREMLTAAGAEVERATHLNALPSLWGALREHATPSARRAAALGPGLAIRPPGGRRAWLDRILYGVSAFEARLLAAFEIGLPFGHSTAFVARRPAGPAGSGKGVQASDTRRKITSDPTSSTSSSSF
jgi:SAM-dependent methyltransferase